MINHADIQEAFDRTAALIGKPSSGSWRRSLEITPTPSGVKIIGTMRSGAETDPEYRSEVLITACQLEKWNRGQLIAAVDNIAITIGIEVDD